MALEEEKDKMSTWQEERDMLLSDLDDAQQIINTLRKEKTPQKGVPECQGDVAPARQIQAPTHEDKFLQDEHADACTHAQQFQGTLMKAQNEQENIQLRQALQDEREKVRAHFYLMVLAFGKPGTAITKNCRSRYNWKSVL